MRVLFKNRFDVFESVGGDTIQMIKTKSALEKMGVEVDIQLGPVADLSDYDVVHVFNVLRSLETTFGILEARAACKPVVCSSIYWDFDELNCIGRHSSMHRMLHKYFSEFQVEKLKEIIRGPRLAGWAGFCDYFFRDYLSTLKLVDLFLPNSVGEGEVLQRRLWPELKFHPVVNAVDPNQFRLLPGIRRRRRALTVARIDPRKNILALLASEPAVEVDLYGAVSRNHTRYADRVSNSLGSKFFLRGPVSQDQLCELYNSHQLHILPSWLETPGLSQLEAAASGCNIVSTNRGSPKEYFGALAHYCDPASAKSIGVAIQNAIEDPVSPRIMSEYVLDKFTWEICALQTLTAYQTVIEG